MFGNAALATQPFAALEDIRFYVIVRTTLTTTFEYIIYVATQEFATEPDDALSSQPFRGTLQNPLSNFRRSILSGEGIGAFTSGDGQLVIDNTDAFYDFLIQQYTVDGRDIVVKIGRIGDPYDEYFIIFKGTASDWNIDESTVSVSLRDNGYRLKVPAQPNLYGGTGGADGGADLASKRKPRAFGPVSNIEPPIVVPGLLIYQVNDGPVNAITAVYDRGVALTPGSNHATYALLAAATPLAGRFDTCLAEGFFSLGSTPAGTITADVQGDKTGGTYRTTSADIARLLIGEAPEIIDPADVYGLSFDAVNTAQPAPIGYWLGPDDTPTIADVVADIMAGIGGWAGFRRDGRIELGIFMAPTGLPSARYDSTDILDIKREKLPASLSPPPWRWRVPYALNWTVQTDLAGGVSAARKAFVAVGDRLAEAQSLTVKNSRPLAQDPEPVRAYFAQQADAAAEAARRLAIYEVERALYRLTVPRGSLRRNLGEVIYVAFDRFDLVNGRLMTVVELNENLQPPTDDNIDTVEIVAYG